MVFGRSKSSSSSTPSPAAASSAAAAACSDLRAAYHECFNRWYAEKFAKGQWQKDDCVGEWNKYRACLEEHLEDKHLRKILLESETSAHYAQFDADSSSRNGGTSTRAQNSLKLLLFMAKKSKNNSTKRASASSSSSSSAAADGDRSPWLRLTAFAVLTFHSAFSSYLARDDSRLVALVVVGYLLMLVLLFYGRLVQPVPQKRD
uniref:Uncharacterized protein n=1 Tax=Leersia perrieri TaxID=77586 RepID=A0A0D9XCX8_9ORYZ